MFGDFFFGWHSPPKNPPLLSLLEHASLPPPTLARVTAPMTGDELLAAAEERALGGSCGAPRCASRVAPLCAARPKRLLSLAGVPAPDPRFCGPACAADTHALAASLGGPVEAAVRAGLARGPAPAPAPRAPCGAAERSPGLAAGTRDVPILRSTVVERVPSGGVPPVATPPTGRAAAAVDGYVPRAAAAVATAATAPPSSSIPRSARLRKSVSWRDEAPGGRLATVRRVGGAGDAPPPRAAAPVDSSDDDDDENSAPASTPSPGAGPSSDAPTPAAVIEFELDGDDDGDVQARFGRLKISEPASLDAALADLDLSDAPDPPPPTAPSRSPSPPPAALPPPADLAAMLAARDAAAAADLAAWRDRLVADDEEAEMAAAPPPPPPPAARRAARLRSREPASPGTPERSVRRARGGSPVSPSGSEGDDDDDDASSSSSLALGGADAWLDAPPDGHARTSLSTFGGVVAALDAWATTATRTLLADATAPPPRRDDNRAAADALGAPLTRGLAPILAALRISVPRSTVEGALSDVLATFMRVPVPPLSEPQWCAVALTLTKALSLVRLRSLAPAFEGRDALARVSVLLARLGLTIEAFSVLMDVVMEAS